MPNQAVVREFPIHSTTEPKDRGELSRLVKILIWTGTLMTQPENPRGWSLNPAVITLCILIASLLTGGGYYVGHLAAEIEFLKQQQVHTEAVAQDAEKVAGYSVAQSDKGDGHKITNTNTNTSGGH